jgi:2'-5' RNA ligase
MRLFVAVALPDEVAAEALALCRDLPAARWTHPGQLHLTLRFLGELADDGPLRAALRRIGGAPFTVGLAGVGVFPRHRRRPAQVLWMGVNPEEPLRALEARIGEALAPHAPPPDHAFSPHLTLARFRDDPGPALAQYLDTHAAFTGRRWSVGAFHLYRSILGPGRAVHEVVESYPLAGP